MELLNISNDSKSFTFNFDGVEIRGIWLESKPWFVLNDINNVLEFSRSRDAIRNISEDYDKLLIKKDNIFYSAVSALLDIPNRGLYLISKYGFYDLILSSKTKKAREFKKFVTHVILPSIDEHGFFLSKNTIEEIDQGLTSEDMKSLQVEFDKKLELLEVENKLLSGKMIRLEPKARKFIKYTNKNNEMDLGTAGELLTEHNLGRNSLFRLLRDIKWLTVDNRPYQRIVNSGYMNLRIDEENLSHQPFLTNKGFDKLSTILQGMK